MIPQYTERELKQKLNFLLAIKKIVFGINIFIWAAGCTAACIGIWFRVERDFTTLIQRIEEADINFTSGYILLGANLLISIGATIAFVGLLGSLSVSKENEKLLFLYSALMFGVFGMYVACATWGFVKLDYLKGIVSDAMRELFNKAMIEKLSSAKYAVNEIQKQLQCCGNVGPSEYAGDIPPTCSSYIIGCNQAFYDFFWRNLLLISLIGLVFGVCQLIALIIAGYFGNEIRIARKFEKACRQLEESKRLIKN
ncbi:unnamed protein product [Brachionus calyciflorus]|uniref:Tetraspanin n=1 Tax=Brachionus calyciflorus TaxID=104777 RepID=A0A813QEF6_9BILA|nr:unnamed protein product [Brachionus calyciflorus]